MEHPPITKEIAEEWLLSELQNNYLAGVLKASPGLLAYPRVLGALTDFAYNLGVARYRGSTLRKRVDAQDWEGAIEQLLLWDKAGGRKLPGLTRRRQAEAVLMR